MTFSLLLGTLLAVLVAVHGKNATTEMAAEVKEVIEGKEMFSTCTAPYPIEECQWTYRINNTDEDIIVKQFPTVGEHKNACSIHFQRVKFEHEGMWTCLVRKTNELNFTARLYLNVKVLPMPQGIEFVQFVQQATKPVSYPLHLWCKVNRPVEECQWTWEPFETSEELANDDHKSPGLSRTVVKTFRPADVGSVDCSLFLEHVLEGDAGIWHCGVREKDAEIFTFGKATSVHTNHPDEETIYPAISFEENELKFGDDLNLTCKASFPVSECRWSHKYQNEELFSFKKQFFAGGEGLNDCSFQIQKVTFDQHGLWSCEVKTSKRSNYKTISTIQVNIFPRPKDVEFILLTGKASKPIGSPISLGCKVNWPVWECQWVLMNFNNSENTTFIKQFHPPDNKSSDCSLHLDYILEEQQGYWICGVRWSAHEKFFTSPPIEVILYPPVSISFLEEPRDVEAQLGDDVVLRCVTTTPVDECRWLYNAANQAGGALVVKKFPPFGDYRRNCSVRFSSVVAAQDGLWSCAVSGPPNSSVLASARVRLRVSDHTGAHRFADVSEEVRGRVGGAATLRCVSAVPVRACRWTARARLADGSLAAPGEAASFAPVRAGRDCSLRVAVLRRAYDGEWRCAVLVERGGQFLPAPRPTLVYVQREEPVVIDFINTAEHKISMTCRLRKPNQNLTCFWRYAALPHLGIINDTDRFIMFYNETSGECTITFEPAKDVLGKWSCFFKLKTAVTQKGIISAQMVLVGNDSVGKLNWLIGVLASAVLMLLLLLFGISFYKVHHTKKMQAKEDLGNPTLHADRGSNDLGRYTQTPTKIDFQFQDTHSPTANLPEVSASQNVYERVGRYSSPAVCKSIYENIS